MLIDWLGSSSTRVSSVKYMKFLSFKPVLFGKIFWNITGVSVLKSRFDCFATLTPSRDKLPAALKLGLVNCYVPLSEMYCIGNACIDKRNL